MNVPERADKWIVFLAMLAIAGVDLFNSTGIALNLTDVVVVMGLFAVIGTISYLAWRGVCRVVARLLGDKLSPGSVRTFANGVFAAAVLALILEPVLFPGHEVIETFQVPVKEK